MSSPELIDQKILKSLCHQIESKKWATTYLFIGKELERKKALAIAFAKALNCAPLLSSPQNGGRNKVGGDVTPCGKCSVCRRIEEGNFPDVKWYGTDEEINSIKISEVRDFRNWLNLKSFEGKVKVFIFNQAERLTAEAQNALLKSLEEPPPGNVIIFLVPHAKSLFDTISSRATHIKVPCFSSRAIRDILIQNGASESEAEFLARMSQGDLTRAKKAHEDKWFQEKNKWLDTLVKNPISFLDEFHSASRDGISRALDFLIEWTRDLLVFRATEGCENLIHLDRFELIHSIVSKRDFETILELFEELNQIRKSIDDYANQKLVLTQTEVLLEHFFKS